MTKEEEDLERAIQNLESKKRVSVSDYQTYGNAFRKVENQKNEEKEKLKKDNNKTDNAA